MAYASDKYGDNEWLRYLETGKNIPLAVKKADGGQKFSRSQVSKLKGKRHAERLLEKEKSRFDKPAVSGSGVKKSASGGR